ncbi:MAG: 50S ribosomal protein L15, partial [Anaerolineales bacterium]
AHKARKRCGRGEGSGLGKTSGRGSKGAKARSGWRRRYGYEGGQMPLSRRVPKRGFNNVRFAAYYDVVNVGALQGAFDDGATVNLEAIVGKGLLKPRFGQLKVLGEGALAKRLSVVCHTASAGAKRKIEAAGGSLTCLVPPRLPRKRFVPRPPAAAGKAGGEAAAAEAGAKPAKDKKPAGEPGEKKAKAAGKPPEAKTEKAGKDSPGEKKAKGGSPS